MADILDKVDLTTEAVAAYQEFARRVAFALRDLNIHPDDIPDEQAYENNEGGLVIYVDLPQREGRLEFTIPPSEWAWRNRN